MFTAYILKSEKDGTYYYGSTKDLTARLKYHNTGKVKYTKSKRPWKVHYFEEFDNRSDAAKREMFWKTVNGYKWLKENSIT
jgi:putative endonuclease